MKDSKKKSLFLLGKCEYFNLNTENAILHLTDALNIINSDINGGNVETDSSLSPPNTPNKASNNKELDEINDLLSKALKRQQSETKKEKSMWSKAFNANSNTPEEVAPAPSSSSMVHTNVNAAPIDYKNIKIDLSKIEGLNSASTNNSTTNNTSKMNVKSVADKKSKSEPSNEIIPKNNNNWFPWLVASFSGLLGMFFLGYRYQWFIKRK